MIKVVFGLFILFSTLTYSLEFELVEDTSKPKDPNNNFFMKEERKVYRAMELTVVKALEQPVIKAIEQPIVKAIKIPVIKAFEIKEK